MGRVCTSYSGQPFCPLTIESTITISSNSHLPSRFFFVQEHHQSKRAPRRSCSLSLPAIYISIFFSFFYGRDEQSWAVQVASARVDPLSIFLFWSSSCSSSSISLSSVCVAPWQPRPVRGKGAVKTTHPLCSSTAVRSYISIYVCVCYTYTLRITKA